MNLLGVPDCNLTNVDYKIGIKVFNGLETCFAKYPMLKNVINCVGDIPYVLEQRSAIASKVYKVTKPKYNLRELYKTASFGTAYLSFDDENNYDTIDTAFYFNRLMFTGICINEKDSYEDLRAMLLKYRKNNTSYSINIETCIYHEVGHILSRMLCLEKNEFTVNVIMSLMENDQNYPKYAMSSVSEFIADCFAKYMIDPDYNIAVNTIGKMIDMLYNRFEITWNDLYTQDLYKEKVLKIER